ncbi:PAS domain S-box protein [bacterium]|nr:PAS domain S-box protein [bacterium]
MRFVSLPVVCMAAVTFYVGFYHLFLYFKRRHTHPEDLSFAITCFTMGFYDIMCIGAYNTASTVDGFRWQKSQVAVLSLTGAVYTWFITDYVGLLSKRWRNLFMIFFCVSALLVEFINTPLIWHPDRPAVKRIPLPMGLEMIYHEVVPGLYTEFLGIMGLVVFFYVYALNIRQAAQDKTKSTPLFYSNTLFCIGLVNDALVHSGIYSFLYTIEFAYMAVVLLMARTLSRAVVESAILKDACEISEKKYRDLVNHLQVGIFISQDRIIRFCNERFAALFGYPRSSDVTGFPVEKLIPSAGDSGRNIGLDETAGRMHGGFETRGIRADGTAVDLEIMTGIIRYGSGPAVQGSVIDITPHKISEARIQQDLHEKEVLLREIHHRVKNNLQIISSLLNLEQVRSKDPNIRRTLQDCNRRIQSMAMIHDRLYHTERLDSIDFSGYAQILVKDSIISFGVSNRIAVRLKVESIPLGIDTAIPCGLILNEMVTNAIKHGFPDERPGTLSVRFMKRPDGFYEMSVMDDGVGLPPEAELDKSKSLGLTLIDVLVQQLEGTLRIERKNGTRFTVRFKASENLKS